MKHWFNKYKGAIGRTLITIILSVLVSFGVIYGIFCWHFGIDPTTLVRHFEIEKTTIAGPGSLTEDGKAINGFILKDKDNGTEYLVTDYWSPIALVDEKVEVNQ